MTIPIALSPCPNDTYLFHAWIKGSVGTQVRPIAQYADIEQLNSWALQKKYPLIKVSISCFTKLQKDYVLLDVGCALGWNCGPKLIAKGQVTLDQVGELRVGLPGRETTAHYLFDLFCKEPKQKVFCRYHEIEGLLQSGKIDAGVIIHETRFTHGYHEVADFGQLWQARYALPLPLGGIALLKDYDAALYTSILRDSLAYARRYPESSVNFILEHAQVKNRDVIQKHIDLYVTEETANLSEQGREAIKLMVNPSKLE